MAWQVLLLRLPEGATSIAALPRDYHAPSLGDPAEVAARMQATHGPGVTVERHGARLVVFRSEDMVIEAELGGMAEVDRVLLRVLGSDAAYPLVCALAHALGASAVDCETDRVLDADSEVPDTLRQWQNRIEDLR